MYKGFVKGDLLVVMAGINSGKSIANGTAPMESEEEKKARRLQEWLDDDGA
jgi:lysophospholipase L1-like esterase